ncbi:hypothetical protein N7453_000096 [Penicillium expansum]|nr:hypothetical protein N7453_000096 [Penicillium expansum]
MEPRRTKLAFRLVLHVGERRLNAMEESQNARPAAPSTCPVPSPIPLDILALPMSMYIESWRNV